MDNLLLGMSGVTCRVDDILITGKDMDEHIARVTEVIRRLKKAGFRCGWKKSEFLKEKVVYLGYEVTKEGVKPCRSKVETLLKAAYPTKLSELVSFLGAVQYYGRFLPQLSTLIEPLNRLRTSKEWIFGEEEKKCYNQLKDLLASDSVLTFYDPKLPLRVDCDASSYGIGAVLSHIDDNGVDRPIEFISRTLTSAERKYSQIEKEALGIVWSIKRFHRYLYARPFELYTDHKPLELIFHPSKLIPDMGTSRIQRWALVLSHYQYTIKYRSTDKHSNADLCSRYPLSETEDGTRVGETDDEVSTVFSLHMDDDKPLLNSQLIAKLSKKDPTISKVMYCVNEGWPEVSKRPKFVPEKATTLGESHVPGKRPDTVPEKATGPGDPAGGNRQRPVPVPDEVTGPEESPVYKAYHVRRTELSTESGCLLWGHRVVIPESLRKEVLTLLHSTHMGMTAMKGLARNYVWWPKLDNDIENMVRQCETCQLNQRQPNKAAPHPWRNAQSPWERIHLDFAGPFLNRMWMLVVDSYSKWIEVFDMRNNTKSANMIRKLRTLFSRFGLPKILVSDNGPQLISAEFENFCLRNGINHIPIPSYHPATSGQVESVVGKFKAAMEKMQVSNSDVGLNLANWLLNYHNTPHSVTGVEPSIRMLGRRIRSALSLVHPLSCSRQQANEEKQVIEADKTLRRFVVGDPVLYRDVLHKSWHRGVVKEVSDKQYIITKADGSVVKKHIDHIVASTSEPATVDKFLDKVVEAGKTIDGHNESGNIQIARPEQIRSRPTVEHEQANTDPSISTDTRSQPDNELSSRPSLEFARPARTTRPPDRLGYDKLGGE